MSADHLSTVAVVWGRRNRGKIILLALQTHRLMVGRATSLTINSVQHQSINTLRQLETSPRKNLPPPLGWRKTCAIRFQSVQLFWHQHRNKLKLLQSNNHFSIHYLIGNFQHQNKFHIKFKYHSIKIN